MYFIVAFKRILKSYLKKNHRLINKIVNSNLNYKYIYTVPAKTKFHFNTKYIVHIFNINKNYIVHICKFFK